MDRLFKNLIVSNSKVYCSHGFRKPIVLWSRNLYLAQIAYVPQLGLGSKVLFDVLRKYLLFLESSLGKMRSGLVLIHPDLEF